MTSPVRRLSFPQIRRVVLDKFSLYTQRPGIELDVSAGVLCLAGANGIGKSTFLSAINYGLTGIVPLASREFMSAAEYYKDGLRFSHEFFDGRIEEDDRDGAQITVEFDVGKTGFQLTRGLFEADSLRALSITVNGKPIDSADAPLSAEEKNRLYCTQVAKVVGVKSFEQFVFLQHFVLTFDESRHLLFWDPRALEQALYLAFGTDPEIAAAAERLRREMEKAESRGRNIQYHATNVFNRIQTLEDVLGTPAGGKAGRDEELREKYAGLLKERDQLEKEVDQTEAKASDAEVALAEASAAHISLRKDYDAAFEKLTGRRSIVDSHPLVRTSLDDERCALCGATGKDVNDALKSALKRHECPLCESKLQPGASGQGELLANLKKIDAALAKAKGKVETCATTRSRLAKEKTQVQDRFATAQEAVRAFETMYEKAIAKVREREKTASGGVAQALENLRTEHETLQAERRKAYTLRDEKKKELKKLQRSLESSYAAAEEEFVPRFRALAELFLGIELDVRLEGKAATGLVLILELRSTLRREKHQLSESQRFFVDIALRMALAQFMSNKEAPAGLLIDTPEGSLDIAYESRAGEMFAEFVKGGHRIMMTANINTSQLLQKLAKECGAKRMTLTRMTTWTDLSDVQVKESDLFHNAYATIEKELKGAHG
ncbi:MAG: AAA family ATPase [Planctomycetes bacterium]|nr:AAA family ATPase [Planctomycetota bacterium]